MTTETHTGLPTQGQTLVSCESGVDASHALSLGFANVDLVESADPFSVVPEPVHDRVVYVTDRAVPVEVIANVQIPAFVVPGADADRSKELTATALSLEAKNRELARENARLKRELDETVAERADAADVRRRYDALRKSTLGKATLRYWEMRRQMQRRKTKD